MKLSRESIGIATVALGALAVVTAAPSLANHSWGSYHWERTGAEITIPVIDNTDASWTSYVAQAAADWDASDYIAAKITDGPYDSACALKLNEIHVCNDDYGNNNWLGIASISVTRGKTTHIIAGSTKLNDYYFNMTKYDTPAWRMMVACQEIGHDYGLGHQDEGFGAPNLGTCMDYTNDPTGSGDYLRPNLHPNDHDYDQLAAIYSHTHGGDTTSPGPGKGGGKKLGLPGNGPAEWGRAIGFDARGKANVYKREMAGYDIITHVTWVIGEGIDSDPDQPRQHSGDHYFNN